MLEQILSILGQVLQALLLCLALVMVAGSIYFYFFHTEAVMERRLKQQAIEDYRQSRGTAHRRLLEPIALSLYEQMHGYENQINQARSEQDRLAAEREAELEPQLARWLVESRLQEVDGIGEKLKQQIISTVFRGQLSDLRRAQIVPGVGQLKQMGIDRWVNHYESQIPHLLGQQFPGRKEFENRYRQAIKKQEELIREYEGKQEQLRKRLISIGRELEWLREISANDFVQAYRYPERGKAELERYLVGVFPEWESMPDWLRTAVGAKWD